MKKREIEVIVMMGFFMTSLFIILILLLLMCRDFKNESHVRTENTVKTNTTRLSTSYESNIVINEDVFPIGEGITYVCDKGNLRLFADVVKIGQSSLYLYGEAYHIDHFMDDMRINKIILNKLDNSYVNKDNTIKVTVDSDSTITIVDDRDHESMPFTGVFTLKKKSNIPTTSNDTVEEALDIINQEIIVDEDSEEYNDDDFISFVSDVGNERKEIVLPGIYKSAYPEYRGMKYETPSGQVYYVFGRSSSPKDGIDNMRLIYRGYNKKYNGMEFDDYQYCFNFVKSE